MDIPENEKQQTTGKLKNRRLFTRLLVLLAILIGLAAILYGLFVGFAYTTSPAAIREPKFQHYHFRMQILIDGKAQNFAGKEYQVEAGKDVCSANLTKQPIHFHDDKDQMVHIHWDGLTGGMVAKYYGWNYIGGKADSLGYRFDGFPKLTNVPIHGKVLPAVNSNDKFYVFTGDKSTYKEQKWDDFLKKDLEDFFGKHSNLPDPAEDTSFLDALFPKAYAHGSEVHDDATTIAAPQDLERINNLLGSVVIFVQKDHPTAAQVKDRFNKLAPLSMSTCAG